MRSQRPRRSQRRSQSPAGGAHQTQPQLSEFLGVPERDLLFCFVFLNIPNNNNLCLSDTAQEVVGAVAKAGGVQHLISMATSEHVIMQNEALVALAIASAVDIGKAFFSVDVSTGLYLWKSYPPESPRIVCKK